MTREERIDRSRRICAWLCRMQVRAWFARDRNPQDARSSWTASELRGA